MPALAAEAKFRPDWLVPTSIPSSVVTAEAAPLVVSSDAATSVEAITPPTPARRTATLCRLDLIRLLRVVNRSSRLVRPGITGESVDLRGWDETTSRLPSLPVGRR